MSHPFTYCTRCGEHLKELDHTRYICANGHHLYNSPYASTGVLILNGDDTEVLLAVRKNDPAIGKYDIVGGFLKFEEKPVEGAKREVMEESGLEVEIGELIGVYNSAYTEYVSSTAIIYTGHITKGEPKADDDVTELKWFKLSDLPNPEDCAWPYMPQMFKDLCTRTF